ncbi:MAG: hypothetical protein J6D11_08185 [Clostridia bacterium]|nr:hypothetical protein [Clostridia bacterium]
MGKGKKNKKKKQKIKTPPLSLLDKIIYCCLIILCCILCFFIMLLYLKFIPEAVAFREKDIIGVHHSDVGIFLAFPVIFLVILAAVILISSLWENRQPILGNKKFENVYSQIGIYPIFSEKFRKNLTQSEKRFAKQMLSMFVVLFVVFFVISLFGICPRYVLDENNNILKYNSFNQNTDTLDVKDAEKVIIDVGISSGPKRWISTYYLQIEFVFDDNRCSFKSGNFYEMTREETLRHMIYLKNLFPERYEITDADKADKLIQKNHYNAAEASLLYELLDLN